VTPRRWMARIVALLRWRRLDRELDGEIAAHLELAEQHARQLGLSPEDARRRARLEFGDVEAMKEAHRDVRSARTLEVWWRDIRHARVALARAPGFTAAAIILLALGTGATALGFSALRGMLLQPLPLAHAERLVWLQVERRDQAATGDEVSRPEATAVATRSDVFEAVAVVGPRARMFEMGARRAQWHGLWITAGLPSVLDIVPALGRGFGPHDVGSDAMMIGYHRWQQDFGGDPAVLGRVVRFGDNKLHTVIGVLPRGLAFPIGRAPAAAATGVNFTVGEQDFWILGQDSAHELPAGAMVARLRRDVTTTAAAAALAPISEALAREHPDHQGRSLTVATLHDHVLGPLRRALPMLEIFAGLVLLIVCANLASLMLARRTVAQPEIAVRTALGARASDLLRLQLSEGAWLTAAGVAAGLLLAWLGRDALLVVAAGRLPLADRIVIDAQVVLLTFVTGACTAAVCMFVPPLLLSATRSARLDHAARNQAISRRIARALDGLVVSQVAVTLVLLAGAALMVQSLSRLMTIDTGYDRRQVVAADVLLYEPPREVVAFYLKLHERLSVLPGVEAVGVIQSTPLTGKWTFREPFLVEGRPHDPGLNVDVAGSFVAFDYFKAMSIPLIDGRTFTHREFTTPGLPTIVINDVAANRFFPGERAVGRRVIMFGQPREIVGVVKGTRDVRVETAAEPQWYQPIFFENSQVLVRTSTDVTAFVPALRRALEASDPRLIVKNVEPLDEIVKGTLVERRLAGSLLAVFAGVAVLLALVGLYGVVHFRTLRRRHELAVRSALGASRGRLIAMVIGQGIRVTAIGIAIGIVVTLPASRGLRDLLFDVRPGDPVTIGVMSLALLAAAVAACAVPAWRAGSTDPTTVLRTE
jgi:putative ABC transport system permease protein